MCQPPKALHPEDEKGRRQKGRPFFMDKSRGVGTLLLLAFAGLIFLYFWEALTQSKLMVDRDLPIFFFPNLKLWVEAVKGGELPLWNPYSFSGQPLLASLQTAILYPPNLLLLFLPLDFAFNLTIAVHFFCPAGLSIFWPENWGAAARPAYWPPFPLPWGAFSFPSIMFSIRSSPLPGPP